MSERIQEKECVERAAQRKHEMRMARWIVIGASVVIVLMFGSCTAFKYSKTGARYSCQEEVRRAFGPHHEKSFVCSHSRHRIEMINEKLAVCRCR
jgi:hypothetical protein